MVQCTKMLASTDEVSISVCVCVCENESECVFASLCKSVCCVLVCNNCVDVEMCAVVHVFAHFWLFVCS